LADFTDKPFSLVGAIRRFTDKSRKGFSDAQEKKSTQDLMGLAHSKKL
jgi:hypothetical protein